MTDAVVFNRQKFRAALLYVARESKDDIRFGLTKLNKILYFSDFKAFAILGCAITGATYRRLDYGPVPSVLLDVLCEMEAEGRDPEDRAARPQPAAEARRPAAIA